jgi:hypothetical protein
MNQARSLLGAGMKKAIDSEGSRLILIGKWVSIALIQPVVTLGNKMIHAETLQFQRGHRWAPAIIHIATARLMCHGGSFLFHMG